MNTCSIDRKNLVYIPWGADKGDCPFCASGVLARNSTVEHSFCVKEGYSCDSCGLSFIEALNALDRPTMNERRYFVGVSSFVEGVLVHELSM